jgi:hypothetical protein
MAKDKDKENNENQTENIEELKLILEEVRGQLLTMSGRIDEVLGHTAQITAESGGIAKAIEKVAEVMAQTAPPLQPPLQQQPPEMKTLGEAFPNLKPAKPKKRKGFLGIGGTVDYSGRK